MHLADMMDAEIWKFKAAQALGEGVCLVALYAQHWQRGVPGEVN